MISKILDYLNIRQAGGIELFFSTLLILSGYSFNGIPLQVVLWCLLFVLLLTKKKHKKTVFRPLVILAIYFLVHDFVYLFIANGNFNAFVMQIVYFGCTMMAINVFEINRLKGSLNVVAIISMVGLLYQLGIIAAGGGVHPIQIPFLDMGESRLESLSARPSSFFMEPAAYVEFMYIPLIFSLLDRKFVWTAIIILSEFLTTSTTGLLTSFIMLLVYVFTQKVSVKIRFFAIVLGGVMLFSLTHFEAFKGSTEKLDNTDVETNVRLSQGPYVVSTMSPEEMFFGASYSSAYQYCSAGRAPYVVYYGKEVYLSTTWRLLLIYGFLGLYLYLLFYYKIIREDSETIPLVVCLIGTMFSSGFGVGLQFVYSSIPLLLLCYKK